VKPPILFPGLFFILVANVVGQWQMVLQLQRSKSRQGKNHCLKAKVCQAAERDAVKRELASCD